MRYAIFLSVIAILAATMFLLRWKISLSRRVMAGIILIFLGAGGFFAGRAASHFQFMQSDAVGYGWFAVVSSSTFVAAALLIPALFEAIHHRWPNIWTKVILPLAALGLVITVGVSMISSTEHRLYMMAVADGSIKLASGEFIETKYTCERNHKSVDFDKRKWKSTDMFLTSAQDSRRAMNWTISEPGGPEISATSFDLPTGSIGRGIQWRGTNGGIHTAFLSFSDLVGEHGPQTVWVEERGGSNTAYPGNEPDYNYLSDPRFEHFTCGPVSRKKKTIHG